MAMTSLYFRLLPDPLQKATPLPTGCYKIATAKNLLFYQNVIQKNQARSAIVWRLILILSPKASQPKWNPSHSQIFII